MFGSVRFLLVGERTGLDVGDILPDGIGHYAVEVGIAAEEAG